MSVQAFESRFSIRGFDCGYGGPLRILALADLLQEAAYAHAEELRFGKDSMGESGRTWMMSRADLRVYRSPREGETVTVRTWPASTERLFALRDFQMEDERGALLAAASYAYLIIDIAARRPLRPEGILPPELRADRPRALAEPRYAAERPEAAWTEAFAETAGMRHLDHNGHVNNAHLIAWLCDAPPSACRGTGLPAELHVEFAQEVLPGAVLTVSWAPLPPCDGLVRYAAELRRGDEICARADMAWG
ncbi:MAG: hypothetical protein A2Z99_13450 [Treponema sp. GWB1_62_6]|nr:MAG: hypothetical protein A2Y36_18565 [Treponema sp. GWA1_62_8]OHE67613.1 MAG: hypothetical protein A2001_19680 [Treponema sp. GWC1_61_84]OHE70015.1 MAG: hypothetical protein A2Z99_13450 [Treponema sp. GWB1_62_6]OHE70527.1 MAG: hypothetical protein A2413_19340 [Treponema sp. RIFOXYC1_FULL_61_9]HCM25839.1 hypothetical protein [Treponema sp.]